MRGARNKQPLFWINLPPPVSRGKYMTPVEHDGRCRSNYSDIPGFTFRSATILTVAVSRMCQQTSAASGSLVLSGHRTLQTINYCLKSFIFIGFAVEVTDCQQHLRFNKQWKRLYGLHTAPYWLTVVTSQSPNCRWYLVQTETIKYLELLVLLVGNAEHA